MLEFFGMKSVPFTREIDPAQLFVSSIYTEATARLEFAVKHRQVCLLTGEPGMGKTVAVSSFLRRIDPMRYRYEYLCDSALTPKLFYREVLERFGMEASTRPTEAKRQYQTLMLDLFEQDKKIPILVLDESHHLSEAMLQEIRFLLNFREDTMSPVALVLVGQPSLRNQLKVKHMEAIDQRIQIRFQMSGLNERETCEYVRHQVKSTGTEQEVFSEEAILEIYQFTQGVPRKVNTLCSQSMLDAYVQNNKIVGVSHVHRVMNEL